MEGLSTLANLRVLDVSSNKLTSVDDIENLTLWVYILPANCFIFIASLRSDWIAPCRLEDLWLNDNQITSLEGIAEAVAGSREKLTTIYLENNPCVWFLKIMLVGRK